MTKLHQQHIVDQPLVGLAINSAGNRNLLQNMLAERYKVSEGLGGNALRNTEFDLIIVDVASLSEIKSTLLEIKEELSPAILPVLLIAENDKTADKLIKEELGTSVEDILRVPTTQAELAARIDNLSRLRRLSLQQKSVQLETENALQGVSRALNTLNKCNEILVRENDEQTLLDSICQVIVDEGGYCLSWIGTAEQRPEKDIRIHAWAGPKSAYLSGIRISWGNDMYGKGPSGQAAASGKTVTSTNIATDPNFEAWRNKALAHGLAALICIPMKNQYGPNSLLCVYSDSPGAFSNEEQKLLERLAENVAYGIDAIRNRDLRAQRESEIHSLAYTDLVTGLPNRQALLEQIQILREPAHSDNCLFAILFIDLDGFKLVNDALGHGEGDRVLSWIGERLQKAVRVEDFVARQGGDEFIVVMLDSPRNPPPANEDAASRLQRSATQMAERLIEHVKAPFMINGVEYRLGASIGIALANTDRQSINIEELVNWADIAMYQAKNSNAGWEVYSSELGEKRQRRLSLESRLYHALENQEFHLFYQPLIDLKKEKMVGAEALIRWQLSDGNFISPGEFIPVAEQSGLIIPIGDWVIKQAAEQLECWQCENHDFYMAINLSVSQLQKAGICQRIISLLPERITPASIKLEVTEGALISESKNMEGCLHELHESGFRLAVDDFGTGYSSLARLQRLPIHTLKIDKQFVDGLPDDKAGRAIANTILGLGRSLNMEVLAEGIETRKQRDYLRDIGCDRGQGFLFSRPCPPEDFYPYFFRANAFTFRTS